MYGVQKKNLVRREIEICYSFFKHFTLYSRIEYRIKEERYSACILQSINNCLELNRISRVYTWGIARNTFKYFLCTMSNLPLKYSKTFYNARAMQIFFYTFST